MPAVVAAAAGRCHLTPSALNELDRRLLLEFFSSSSDAAAAAAAANNAKAEEDWEGGSSLLLHSTLARACIRYRAHKCIDKYAATSRYSREEVEDALKFHELPPGVREGLASSSARVGEDVDDDVGGGGGGAPPPPPANWHEELERLKRSTSSGRDGGGGVGGLWRLVCDHPMTSYVPVQCMSCGLVVPDQYPPDRTDAEGCRGRCRCRCLSSDTTSRAIPRSTVISCLRRLLPPGWGREPIEKSTASSKSGPSPQRGRQ